MPTYTQEDRVFRVETPLGSDVLLLEGFSGEEGVSRPFRFVLELLSRDASIDPQEILRAPVAISLRTPGGDRVIHGRVSRFSQGSRAGDLTAYRAEVVPWLWFLSLSTDCRIFQEKSVPEIVEEIFGDYPDAEFENRCAGSYPPREFCVQYRETDLNFVSRLMEEEGIFYFFEHTTSGHTLVFADDPNAIPDSAQARARMLASPDEPDTEEVILDLRREHSVHPTSVVLTDYDPLHPSLNLQSTARSEDFEEVFEFPGKYTEVSDGERYATLILEERSARRDVLEGTSSCRGFQSGHKFALEDYYRPDTNQSYLLVAVQHTASGGGYRSGRAATRYRNHFVCIPDSVPFRPPRVSRKPMVNGAQSAVVVGPSGEEIFTDEHGRVKVKFHWDRAPGRDDTSSCWIRVSHPWAGKGWGTVAIPRMGQEVIVDFLEGDPDRPIITGRVYNAEQVPPYALPANKTQSGMKSRSSQGGGGSNFNEIRMEDKKGEELLYIHAEKDQQIVVENSRNDSVGNNETISIGNNRSETVGKDEAISIGANRSETVGKNESVSIGSNATHSVGEKMDLSVGSNLTESVGGNRSETTDKNLTVTVGKSSGLSVGEAFSVQVGKDHTEEVGKNFALKVSKKIFIEGGDQIEIKSGKSSIILKKNGDIQIKGKKIKVEGSGDVVVKGSKIAEN